MTEKSLPSKIMGHMKRKCAVDMMWTNQNIQKLKRVLICAQDPAFDQQKHLRALLEHHLSSLTIVFHLPIFVPDRAVLKNVCSQFQIATEPVCKDLLDTVTQISELCRLREDVAMDLFRSGKSKAEELGLTTLEASIYVYHMERKALLETLLLIFEHDASKYSPSVLSIFTSIASRLVLREALHSTEFLSNLLASLDENLFFRKDLQEKIAASNKPNEIHLLQWRMQQIEQECTLLCQIFGVISYRYILPMLILKELLRIMDLMHPNDIFLPHTLLAILSCFNSSSERLQLTTIHKPHWKQLSNEFLANQDFISDLNSSNRSLKSAQTLIRLSWALCCIDLLQECPSSNINESRTVITDQLIPFCIKLLSQDIFAYIANKLFHARSHKLYTSKYFLFGENLERKYALYSGEPNTCEDSAVSSSGLMQHTPYDSELEHYSVSNYSHFLQKIILNLMPFLRQLHNREDFDPNSNIDSDSHRYPFNIPSHHFEYFMLSLAFVCSLSESIAHSFWSTYKSSLLNLFDIALKSQSPTIRIVCYETIAALASCSLGANIIVDFLYSRSTFPTTYLSQIINDNEIGVFNFSSIYLHLWPIEDISLPIDSIVCEQVDSAKHVLLVTLLRLCTQLARYAPGFIDKVPQFQNAYFFTQLVYLLRRPLSLEARTFILHLFRICPGNHQQVMSYLSDALTCTSSNPAIGEYSPSTQVVSRAVYEIKEITAVHGFHSITLAYLELLSNTTKSSSTCHQSHRDILPQYETNARFDPSFLFKFVLEAVFFPIECREYKAPLEKLQILGLCLSTIEYYIINYGPGLKLNQKIGDIIQTVSRALPHTPGYQIISRLPEDPRFISIIVGALATRPIQLPQVDSIPLHALRIVYYMLRSSDDFSHMERGSISHQTENGPAPPKVSFTPMHQLLHTHREFLHQLIALFISNNDGEIKLLCVYILDALLHYNSYSDENSDKCNSMKLLRPIHPTVSYFLSSSFLNRMIASFKQYLCHEFVACPKVSYTRINLDPNYLECNELASIFQYQFHTTSTILNCITNQLKSNRLYSFAHLILGFDLPAYGNHELVLRDPACLDRVMCLASGNSKCPCKSSACPVNSTLPGMAINIISSLISQTQTKTSVMNYINQHAPTLYIKIASFDEIIQLISMCDFKDDVLIHKEEQINRLLPILSAVKQRSTNLGFYQKELLISRDCNPNFLQRSLSQFLDLTTFNVNETFELTSSPLFRSIKEYSLLLETFAQFLQRIAPLVPNSKNPFYFKFLSTQRFIRPNFLLFGMQPLDEILKDPKYEPYSSSEAVEKPKSSQDVYFHYLARDIIDEVENELVQWIDAWRLLVENSIPYILEMEFESGYKHTISTIFYQFYYIILIHTLLFADKYDMQVERLSCSILTVTNKVVAILPRLSIEYWDWDSEQMLKLFEVMMGSIRTVRLQQSKNNLYSVLAKNIALLNFAASSKNINYKLLANNMNKKEFGNLVDNLLEQAADNPFDRAAVFELLASWISIEEHLPQDYSIKTHLVYKIYAVIQLIQQDIQTLIISRENIAEIQIQLYAQEIKMLSLFCRTRNGRYLFTRKYFLLLLKEYSKLIQARRLDIINKVNHVIRFSDPYKLLLELIQRRLSQPELDVGANQICNLEFPIKTFFYEHLSSLGLFLKSKFIDLAHVKQFELLVNIFSHLDMHPFNEVEDGSESGLKRVELESNYLTQVHPLILSRIPIYFDDRDWRNRLELYEDIPPGFDQETSCYKQAELQIPLNCLSLLKYFSNLRSHPLGSTLFPWQYTDAYKGSQAPTTHKLLDYFILLFDRTMDALIRESKINGLQSERMNPYANLDYNSITQILRRFKSQCSYFNESRLREMTKSMIHESSVAKSKEIQVYLDIIHVIESELQHLDSILSPPMSNAMLPLN